jgi:hypothetical protein
MKIWLLPEVERDLEIGADFYDSSLKLLHLQVRFVAVLF